MERGVSSAEGVGAVDGGSAVALCHARGNIKPDWVSPPDSLKWVDTAWVSTSTISTEPKKPPVPSMTHQGAPLGSGTAPPAMTVSPKAVCVTVCPTRP